MESKGEHRHETRGNLVVEDRNKAAFRKLYEALLKHTMSTLGLLDLLADRSAAAL
jgi:hypothetical protein